MHAEIVGRDDELALVSAFLERAGEGVTALELEGAAGIGKSTLWLAGVDAARTQGLRVLVSRPAEAERGLAFAGLGDLFDGRARRTCCRQRRRRSDGRSEIALLVRDAPRARRWIRRALGLAVRDALERAEPADAALVVAVDDVQWLDASSAACARLRATAAGGRGRPAAARAPSSNGGGRC